MPDFVNTRDTNKERIQKCKSKGKLHLMLDSIVRFCFMQVQVQMDKAFPKSNCNFVYEQAALKCYSVKDISLLGCALSTPFGFFLVF